MRYVRVGVTKRNTDRSMGPAEVPPTPDEDRQNVELRRLAKIEVPYVLIEYDYGEPRHRSMRKIFPRRIA